MQMLFICVKACCVLEESPIHLSSNMLLHSLTGNLFLSDDKDDKDPRLEEIHQQSKGSASVVQWEWPFTVGRRRTFPHYHVEYPYYFQWAMDTNHLSGPSGFDSPHPLFKTQETHLREQCAFAPVAVTDPKGGEQQENKR